MARRRRTSTREQNANLLAAMERFQTDTAAALRDRLRQAGLTQVALAELMGVSRAQVSQLLSGKANMTLRTVAELAYYLGETPVIEVTDRTRI